MAELYGKETGVAKGRGGSMHFADATKNFWGGYAIVAGHVTIAVGLALAAQRAKEDRVAMVFFGDGSTDNGQFYECLNLAALWKLPVVFLCENNQYGMGVAIDKASAVTDVHHKARMANIESVQIDGMNALAVHEAVQKAVEYASSGKARTSLRRCAIAIKGTQWPTPTSIAIRKGLTSGRSAMPSSAYAPCWWSRA